ncbi:glycosyltransferase family 39 protein [Kibdelosporangium aridum]|uniref:glycosyltransferase family 39 protein n=1 Tax=Kibdelosporangium aridum TaxID=2030 RepID=UPI00056A3369|nr:glycosyltransferase family 39 protein [Kibdelosporangium aridum]
MKQILPDHVAPVAEPVVDDARPAFAGRAVGILAGLVGLALLVTSGAYGYHRDELYFLAAGAHLDWGYVDQPPLVPVLAWTLDFISGGSLVVLRLPAIVLVVLGMLVTAAIAREFGGGKRAQVIASAAYGTAPITLLVGHWLATNSLDMFFWALATLLLVRWVRTRDDRALVLLGVSAGVALQAKYLIVFFLVVTAVAAAVVGPREILRRRMLWVGAGIALVCALPTVIWQAANGWPQLAMSEAIAQAAEATGGRVGYVPTLLSLAGLSAVLLLFGLWRLLAAQQLRQWRFLGWSFIGLLVVFIAMNGRADYLAGMFPLLMAAGAAGLGPSLRTRWVPWVAWPALTASAALAVALMLPVFPVQSLATSPQAQAESVQTVGWPEFSASVGEAYKQLPAGTAVLTEDYAQAGALYKFGPQNGVPTVYSAHRGYWHFGTPPDGTKTVLFVGGDPTELQRFFGSVRPAGKTGNPYGGLKNLALDVPMWVCEQPVADWPQLWQRMRHIA